MCKLKIKMLFLFIFFVTSVFADTTPEDTLKNINKLTPSFYKEGMYGELKNVPENPTNNLRRKVGSAYIANGLPLFIKGRVLDVTGSPIANVTVKIMQTNHYGSYNFLLNEKSGMYDPNFLSTGTSITNNLGQYYFSTVLPGYYGNRAPHIHFQLTHNKFTFETEMFFKNHPRNYSDSKYIKLSDVEKNIVTANTYYVDRNDFSKGMYAVFDIYINYDFTNL